MRIMQEAVVHFVKGPRKPNGIPACFSDKEYIEWMKAEQIAQTKPIRGFICRDCTRDYQLEMLRAGKCCQPREFNITKISANEE